MEMIIDDESFFRDEMPKEIIYLILEKIISTAKSYSDLEILLLICKRVTNLILEPVFLKDLPSSLFPLNGRTCSVSAGLFLLDCIEAGNVEASYTGGMIMVYSLENTKRGEALLNKAASSFYAPAIYALAVIKFNNAKGHEDEVAGISLCARAAELLDVRAILELGYRFKLGIDEDRRIGTMLIARAKSFLKEAIRPEPPVVHGFLVEWFSTRGAGSRPSLSAHRKICKLVGCGLTETKPLQFRLCPTCGDCYCSFACQKLDWMLGHREKCLHNAADEDKEMEADDEEFNDTDFIEMDTLIRTLAVV